VAEAQGTGRAERAAVVGDPQTVIAFQAAGLAVRPVGPGEDAAAAVTELIAEGYRVIFFTEELTGALAPVLERYRREAVPCLVALPVSAGPQTGKGAAMSRLQDVVRRAVGTDLFKEQNDEQ